MNQIHADIKAINSQIEALRQERALLTVDMISPDNKSPQAIADAYRRHARETAQQSAEVKGIDDAIAALASQLHQKETELKLLQTEPKQLSLEQQVEEATEQAKVHAERINQLAAELADELRALKNITNEISPKYWQVYYKPFITGFKTISVPYIRLDGDVWMIGNRVV